MSKCHKLFKSALLTGGVSCAARLIHGQASCQKSYPFDTKGFPHHPKGLNDPDDNLTLAAVGMRRKNLLVVEVDVYLVGISLSPVALNAAKLWKNPGNFQAPLTEVLLKKSPPRIFGDVDETAVAITLKFMRSVSKAQMMQAFDDALVGCDKDAIIDFRDALDKVIDAKEGLRKGDVIHFDWPKAGGLVVSSDSYICPGIENSGLAKRLLEVYVDDNRTVSKELVKCIKDNIDQIESK